MDNHCSTPEARFTRIREKSPLELSNIHESPCSFDADVQSRGASFISTPISTRVNVIQRQNLNENKDATPLRNVKSLRCAATSETIDDQPSTNPFESYLLDRLHTHTCSPSIFAKVVSPSDEASNGGNFWSIDHIALINPVDIDLSSLQQSASMRTDCETESRIQATVDQYFAESVIAPSPWCESMASIVRTKNRAPSLPSTPSASSVMKRQNFDKCISHASTQTLFTIPPNFDLGAILGNAFRFQETDEKPKDEKVSNSDASDTSNSSLRRQLFNSSNKKKHNTSRSPRRTLQM